MSGGGIGRVPAPYQPLQRTGAPRALQRQPARGMGGAVTTTVATRWEYRVRLRLGSVENLFPDAVTTPMGKKMRLQVLGMFNRPLNHTPSEVQDCLDVSWRHFKEVLYPNGPGNPRTDTQAEAHILTLLDAYLVQGAALPNDGQFARMHTPGGFPVFYSVSEQQAIAGSPYRLGGDRFRVEQAFFADNPVLGKIPIVATVERRTGTNPWQPAPAGIDVHFQLIAPDDISGAAGVRGGALKTNPGAYFNTHVTGYDPSPGTDPQACNAHWHLGGKRKLGAAGEVGGRRAWNYAGGTAARACARDNIFSTASVNGFNAAHGGRVLPHPAFPLATLPTTPASHPSAVTARTNSAGEAGVIFQPSLVGGDRYKLRAYVGAAQPASNAAPGIALTGTMVRWRTIRLSYYIQNLGPTGLGALPPELQNIINAHGAACTHSNGPGRLCLDCILREGQVETIDFGPGHFIANELAKSYCELIVEPSAAAPVQLTSGPIIAAMQRAVTAVAADASAMESNVYGEVLDYSKSLLKSTYTFQLDFGSVEPGSVHVQLKNIDIAVDNSAGALMNCTGKLAGGSGTINYAAGVLSLTFKVGKRPKSSDKLSVTYKTTKTFDLPTLFYQPASSPFLFNMRTPDDYNARVAGPRIKTRHDRGAIGVPCAAYNAKNTLLGNKLLPRFLKEIADNRGVGTGLILVQSPNYETWEGLWSSDCGPTMNGKGIASGFMLLQGNYYKPTVPYPLPAVDNMYAAYPLEPLAMHEMGHCLYMQHSPQGTPGIARLHDYAADTCVMGYDACDGDFCGQCVASYMGLNTEDERFRIQDVRTKGGTDMTKANLASYYVLDPSG